MVARIGSKIMGYDPIPETKKYSFEYGSQEGFVSHDLGKFENTSVDIKCANGYIDITSANEKGAAAVGVSHEYTLRTKYPIGGYDTTSTPQVYPGNTVEFDVENVGSEAMTVRIFAGMDRDQYNGEPERKIFYAEGAAEQIAVGERKTIKWVVDAPANVYLSYMGIALEKQGTIRIHSSDVYGSFAVSLVNEDVPCREAKQFGGWICSASLIRWRNIMSCCDGPAVVISGNKRWKEVNANAEIFLRGSDFAGIVFDYHGLNNFCAVGIGHGKLTVYRKFFGKKEVLYTQEAPDLNNVAYTAAISRKGNKLNVKMGDFADFALDMPFAAGGAAGVVVENGSIILNSLNMTGTMA
jgi:hypothetical protein